METTQNITLKRLLAATAERQAANLHLVVGNKPVLRVGADLVTLDNEDVVTEDFVTGVIAEILSQDQQTKLQKEREVILSYDFLGQARFRVDVTHQRGLHTIVFHFLPRVAKRLEDLGFPREALDLTTLKQGLVFISGPQGSGVSTTLAGFIESVNHRHGKHIVSLEQPIELPLVSYKSIIEQQEVGVDTPGWLEALEIGEQDVDIVVVTKIESGEVFKKLIELATQGMLVCAAYTATSTEHLFEALFGLLEPAARARYAKLLSKSYQGSIIQKLLPRIGGGQVLALELALGTAGIIANIKDQKFDHVANTIQTSRTDGMILLDRYLAELIKSGQVNKEDALSEATNVQALETMLSR